VTSCHPKCFALHSDKCVPKFPNKILPPYSGKRFLPNVLLLTVLQSGISLRNNAVELLPKLLRVLEYPFRMSIQPVLPKILVPSSAPPGKCVTTASRHLIFSFMTQQSQ
jgi:hypothetical protein